MSAMKRTLLAAAGASCRCCSAHRRRREPLKIGFVYVSPIGDAGWTYQHDHGRKEMEKALGAQGRRPSTSRTCPKGADAERVIRELATSGNKLIFTTVVRLHEPDDEGRAKQFPNITFDARDRLQDAARTSARTTRASTKAAISPAHRRQDDQDRTCSATSPRSRSPKCCRASTRSRGVAQRQPEGRSARWSGSTRGTTPARSARRPTR